MSYYPISYFLIMKDTNIQDYPDLYLCDCKFNISTSSSDINTLVIKNNIWDKLRYLACSIIKQIDDEEININTAKIALEALTKELQKIYPKLTELTISTFNTRIHVKESNTIMELTDVPQLSPYVTDDSLLVWLKNKNIDYIEFITNPKYLIIIEDGRNTTSILQTMLDAKIIDSNKIENIEEIYEILHEYWRSY